MASFITYIFLFCLVLANTAFGLGNYKLVHNYDKSNWFTSFKYNTINDPTEGTVDYIGLAESQKSGLSRIVGNQVYLGVDNTSIVDASSRGRKSMLLTSFDEFKYGILIGDFAHMPASDCGTWPAFWSISEGHTMEDTSKLPYGEIDLLETFNSNTNGWMTLHTDPRLAECTFQQTKPFQAGSINQDFTSCRNGPGCSTVAPIGSSGTPFNAQGGGVYAYEWTSQFINMYYFPRKMIPADIKAGRPNTASWGIPVASFDTRRGGCDLDGNFPEQTIYFDTTFCGKSAGGKGWTDWTDCSKTTKVSTCDAYVRQTPHAFDNAYWLINSVKVYQQ
ncbi:glycoside hydrolase family 16 protein [Amylocarpus encephaloides]|uniref:Glycoside hydrolase family 16 protein n=1 Tax=Amylocarpus encephaloides TaxID=45428 RepID=A0A9P8C0L8_9HELO|nr:glycoside hydrolase family 16 protein [Amylocarpus encephaloides]